MSENNYVVCPFCGQSHLAAPGEKPYQMCDCEGAYREREIDKGNALIDILFDDKLNDSFHSAYPADVIRMLKDMLPKVFDEEPVSVQFRLSHDDIVTLGKSNNALIVERKKTLKAKK